MLVLTATGPSLPVPSRLLSSSWVPVVIKQDCWCVINLFKRKQKAKQETWFQLKPILILFYYFPLVRNKTLSNVFWKHVSEVHFSSKGRTVSPPSPVSGAAAWLAAGLWNRVPPGSPYLEGGHPESPHIPQPVSPPPRRWPCTSRLTPAVVCPQAPE